MVFSTYTTLGFWLTLCGYYDNTLYTLYTLVISVEDDLRLVISVCTSKMTDFQVISVEDDFFLGC